VGGGEHRVGALAGVFGDGVAGIVDDIDVVADQSHEDVGAAAAVDEIVAGVAVDDVRQAVSVALQVGDPEQVQVFDVVGQAEMRERQHAIHALPGVLDHGVAGLVDVILIVAEAAAHDVGPRAAVEHVGEWSAVQIRGGPDRGHHVAVAG
jgi:hypothetical protein